MYAPGVNKRGTKKPIPHLPQTTLYSQKYTLPHCPSSLHLQRRRKLQRLADPWASQHATKGFRKGKVQRLTWQHSPACSPWVLHQILLGLIIHKNIATSKRTNLGRGVFKAKGPELFCLLGNFGMLLALFRFACSRLLYWVGPSKKRSLCPLTYAVLQSRSLPLPLEGSSSVTAGAAAAGGGGWLGNCLRQDNLPAVGCVVCLQSEHVGHMRQCILVPIHRNVCFSLWELYTLPSGQCLLSPVTAMG